MADRFHISERLQWSRRTMLAFAGSAAAIGTMTANTAKSAQTQEKMQMGGNREIEQIYQRWDNALGRKILRPRSPYMRTMLQSKVRWCSIC